MFGVRWKRLDLEHQDHRRDSEKADTGVKREIPGMQTQSMSAARKSSTSSPCSSGKSASSEPGGPWNKDSLSCLQAISGGAQSMTAELAVPSKIPHRAKPPPGIQMCEHVRDGVLNGSTHGGAGKQTQSQDILKSQNKMKHLFSKTNTEEITDSERLPSAETLDNFLGGTTTVPLLSTFDILSSESEDEAPVAPPPPTTDRISRGFAALWQHLPKFQMSWRTSQTSLASSHRTGFCQRQSTLVNREEEDAVPKGTSTTDTLQTSNATWGPSASGQQHNVIVGDLIRFCDIKELHIQECQAAQGGTTAIQNAQSLKYGNREIVCRPKERPLSELSNEEEGDQCRTCHSGGSSPTNPLLSPCLCSGSMQFIHLDCLKKCIQRKIQSGSGLCVVKRCELCVGVLTLDPHTFDLDDYHRRQQQQVDATDLYDLQEMSLFSRVVVTPSRPVARNRIWEMPNEDETRKNQRGVTHHQRHMSLLG